MGLIFNNVHEFLYLITVDICLLLEVCCNIPRRLSLLCTVDTDWWSDHRHACHYTGRRCGNVDYDCLFKTATL